MVGLLIGCGTAALMVYAVAARPSGRRWAHARLSSLGISTVCAFLLGMLAVIRGPGQETGNENFLLMAYRALGVLGLVVWFALVLYLARAASLQWRLLRVGNFAGLIELGNQTTELRRLREEILADRAWIAAQMQRTFTTQAEAESVVREMRSREQQIEQRQAKVADLGAGLEPWRSRKIG